MASNEKIAVAAHLHVLLRRKTGRITDTEWMASNAAYALEIVRFARQKAAEDGHADLFLWADRLEEIMRAPEVKARVPLVSMVAHAVKTNSIATGDEHFSESGFVESTFGNLFRNTEPPRQREIHDPNAPRYVKGLR